MKLLETNAISTHKENRARIQIYILAGGFSGIVVGTLLNFKHGDQWGWPHAPSAVLIFGGLLAILCGILWMRLEVTPGVATLTVTKEYEGLSFRVSSNVGDQRLSWPFEWEHWQSFKPIGDDQCLVVNVRLRAKNGDFMGFTETFLDRKTASLGIPFREGRLGNHACVFEIDEIKQLLFVLQSEAGDGFIPPLLPEGSTTPN
jgi:hypothetical protein